MHILQLPDRTNLICCVYLLGAVDRKLIVTAPPHTSAPRSGLAQQIRILAIHLTAHDLSLIHI